MFVTPLLTFLSHTLTHHHHPVVTKSADNGFGDAAASCQLADAWLAGDGINDVSRGSRFQHLRRYDAHRGGSMFHFRVASHTRHRQFIQLQMAEKHVGRVVRMIIFYIGRMVLTIVLCCQCHA